MAVDIPSWLDKSFLAACLHEGDKPEASVVNFVVKPLVAAGNNYSSLMLRVKVDFKREDNIEVNTKSLIVKEPLTTGFVKNLLDDGKINDKETKFYSILRKIGRKLQKEIAPINYPSPLDNILVLEDMNENGYIMGNRKTQLDFAHCEQFILTLAKFHAASVFLHRENPHQIEYFGEEILFCKGKANSKMLELYTSTSLKVFSKLIKKIEGCEEFAEIIMNVSDSMWDQIVENFKPRDTFNVLNHGDVWSTNMLFKYDESGKVVDCKFIDFQMCRYASPTTDLFYFIWTSANFDVRENRLQDLYDSYLLTLNNTLQEIGCRELYSLEDFEKDIKDSSPLALMLICTFLPIMCCEEAVDMDSVFNVDTLNKTLPNIESDTNPFLKHLKHETYKTKLPGLLTQLERFGIFDQLNCTNKTSH